MAKVYEFNNLENQVFYKNTNDLIYYTGEPKELGIREREWLNNLKKEIASTSTYKHNVLVNLTWINANWDKTYTLVEMIKKLGKPNDVKVWYASSIDGGHWITQKNIKFYHYIEAIGYTSSFVGFADEHWYSWIPSWFIDNNLNVDSNSVILNRQPKNLYLSYNRKPRLHREYLINSLIEKNVLDRGWVTFENGHYPQIDSKTGITDQDKHSSDIRFSRPEDVCSIGDLEVWRDSYLVIVSETEDADPYQLSEKTWKPIFGLRPYLINGHRDIYKILERLGLYTPKDFFKTNDIDGNYESIVKQIQALYLKTPEELYDLWAKQFEMLLYNRKRMFEIANTDPTRILNWPQAVPVLA